MDEKQGRYGEFEGRRLQRGMRTMAMKGYVNTISGGQFCQEKVPIVFLDQDLEKFNLPHANPLINKLQIRGTLVSRVLVNGGSSSDIHFWVAF